jgi:hypothetical protein
MPRVVSLRPGPQTGSDGKWAPPPSPHERQAGPLPPLPSPLPFDKKPRAGAWGAPSIPAGGFGYAGTARGLPSARTGLANRQPGSRSRAFVEFVRRDHLIRRGSGRRFGADGKACEALEALKIGREGLGALFERSAGNMPKIATALPPYVECMRESQRHPRAELSRDWRQVKTT